VSGDGSYLGDILTQLFEANDAVLFPHAAAAAMAANGVILPTWSKPCVSLEAAVDAVVQQLPCRVLARAHDTSPDDGSKDASDDAHYLQACRQTMDHNNLAAKSARQDVAVLLAEIRKIAPGMHGLFVQAVAEEDAFLGQVETECTHAVGAMEKTFARLREVIALGKEQIRGAAKGAEIRLKDRLSKVQAEGKRTEDHLQAATARIIAVWQTKSSAYRATHTDTVQAVQAMCAAMPHDSDERTACAAALATLQALGDLLKSAEENMAVAGQAADLGIVCQVITRAKDHVALVVDKALHGLELYTTNEGDDATPGARNDADDAHHEHHTHHTHHTHHVHDAHPRPPSTRRGLHDTATNHAHAPTPEQVEQKLRDAKQQVTQYETKVAELSAHAKRHVTSTTREAVASTHRLTVARANLEAAQATVKILTDELTRARVQQVFKRLSDASSAQAAWLGTADKLKSASKRLMASAASKSEKRFIFAETAKHAAEKTIQEARQHASKFLDDEIQAAQVTLKTILKSVADAMQHMLQQEADTRDKKLSLRALMAEGAVDPASPHVTTFALQYHQRLDMLCKAYIKAAETHLDLVYAWVQNKINGF
jgi:hypothetical protein